MTRIGHERHGVAEESEHRLDGHEGDIHADAQGKSAPVGVGRMGMARPVMGVVATGHRSASLVALPPVPAGPSPSTSADPDPARIVVPIRVEINPR